MKASTLYGLLDTEAVTDLLAEYEYQSELTVPALYHIWAKQDSEFPYIVYRMESIEGNHWNKRTRYAYIDVWDYQEGGSTVTTDDIAKEIKNILHMLKTSDDEWGAMQVRFDNDGYVPEDENYIIHYHSRYRIRAWDVDFVKNSDNY
jgi:hypothetical protein